MVDKIKFLSYVFNKYDVFGKLSYFCDEESVWIIEPLNVFRTISKIKSNGRVKTIER